MTRRTAFALCGTELLNMPAFAGDEPKAPRCCAKPAKNTAADPGQKMRRRMPPFAGAFTINGRSFDPSRVDVRAERGAIESWEVASVSTEPFQWGARGPRGRAQGHRPRVAG